MNIALERLVWQHARSRCEYRQLPQAFSPLPHAVDHIISQQHGPTVEENLALACFSWKRHFMWDGPYLVGRTRTARVTITLLEIDPAEAVELREHLIREGSFPP